MKIVILPGLNGTGALVSEVEALLSLHHSVISMQYPTDLHRYDDINAWILNKLPVGDFIMVAESFSGPLAIMIAKNEPVGLKGIVFVATFARAPRKLPIFLTYILEVMPIKSRLLTGIAQPFLMGRWSTKSFTKKFRKALKPIPTSTIARRLREVLKVNVTEKLDELNLPMIYLSPTDDRLVPTKMSQDFGTVATNVIILDGPHFLLQAEHKASAKQIAKFAAEIDKR